MSDIKFQIDEKNKVVICKLMNCKDIAEDRIWKYTNDFMGRKYRIPNVFIGVARCAPEDEFNVEYGKKIALTRAKIKRSKAINNEIKAYIKRARKNLENLEKYGIHKVPEIEY